jgi:hypothetical protein
LCGFIITSTGITGLYIGKVFEQARGRPVFVIDRVAERAAAAPVEQVQREPIQMSSTER